MLRVLRPPAVDAPSLRFHVEHIKARQHGGSDDPNNLALACGHCNRHKGPNLTGIDPETDQIVPLFNPRQDSRSEHFALDGIFFVGLTPTGRATVHVLAMNSEEQLRRRGPCGDMPPSRPHVTTAQASPAPRARPAAAGRDACGPDVPTPAAAASPAPHHGGGAIHCPARSARLPAADGRRILAAQRSAPQSWGLMASVPHVAGHPGRRIASSPPAAAAIAPNYDGGRGPVHRSAKNVAGTGHKRQGARGGGRTDGGPQYRIDRAGRARQLCCWRRASLWRSSFSVRRFVRRPLAARNPNEASRERGRTRWSCQGSSVLQA